MRSLRPLTTVVAATSLLLGSLATTAGATPAATTAQAPSTTSATVSENAKLNRTPKPTIRWRSCYYNAQCAEVSLPLDYDNPRGAKTTVAILRKRATGTKVGTLFVNPGGPGGSATDLAYYSSQFLTSDIRKRFDIVGVDPRGIGSGSRVKCMSATQQARLLPALSRAFPYGYNQEMRRISASRTLGAACSKNTLARSMSTAQVARDMEMVRRGMGIKQLNFLGFSYGSQLGTTYANMFPANFRAIVIDGVLNPRSWSGTAANQHLPLDQRLGSGKAASKAFTRILDACQQAGRTRCSFASGGDTRRRFDTLVARIKAEPLIIRQPGGEPDVVVDYPTLIGAILGEMYAADAPTRVDDVLTSVSTLSTAARRSTSTPARLREHRRIVTEAVQGAQRRAARGYEYTLDGSTSVICTDSRETTKIASYRTHAKQADTSAPHFGRLWLWGSAACAGDSFTGNDEDAWTGPYNRTTGKTVLVVGNYGDPATSYTGAQETRKILSRARLVSSDSWGHTAYRVSRCATKTIDAYLISGRAPSADTVCKAESPTFPWSRTGAAAPSTVPEIAEEATLPTMTDPTEAFTSDDH